MHYSRGLSCFITKKKNKKIKRERGLSCYSEHVISYARMCREYQDLCDGSMKMWSIILIECFFHTGVLSSCISQVTITRFGTVPIVHSCIHIRFFLSYFYRNWYGCHLGPFVIIWDNALEKPAAQHKGIFFFFFFPQRRIGQNLYKHTNLKAKGQYQASPNWD